MPFIVWEANTSMPNHTATTSSQHILLVENDPGNRALAEYILTSGKFRFRAAVSGREALTFIQREQFDLILTDLSLPDLDGFELVRLIRSLPEYATIPIVAITAHTQAAERRAALQAGCTDVLTKPYRPRQLSQLVNHHVQQVVTSVRV